MPTGEGVEKGRAQIERRHGRNGTESNGANQQVINGRRTLLPVIIYRKKQNGRFAEKVFRSSQL